MLGSADQFMRMHLRMSLDQRQLLDDLLHGDWCRIIVNGRIYAVRKAAAFDWRIRSTSEGEPTYIVNPIQGSCTCPDYKFRVHVCKHVEAVRKF